MSFSISISGHELLLLLPELKMSTSEHCLSTHQVSRSVHSESGDLCELIAISWSYFYYYTDTIKRRRHDRQQAALTETLEQADEIYRYLQGREVLDRHC